MVREKGSIREEGWDYIMWRKSGDGRGGWMEVMGTGIDMRPICLQSWALDSGGQFI